AAVEKQAACSVSAANDAECVCRVSVLRPRLREVCGASFDVSQCGKRRIPARGRVESSAAFVRFAAARGFDGLLRLQKQMLELYRDKIVVVERHRVIAGIALRSDEPRSVADSQTLLREKTANAWVICHLGECARVWAAASAAAGAAVVGGFVR